MSIHAFRAALNGLVAKTRSNPRARPNMAIRQLPGGGIEADTPEELIAYQRALGGQVSRPRPAQQAPRRAAPPQVKAPNNPPTYAQAKAIGFSIGGLGSYCPSLVGQKVEGGAHVQALAQMGLTAGAASNVIEALKKEGLLFTKDPAGQARARQILSSVAGVTCPVPGRAASNPRALPNMAGRPGKFGLPRAPMGSPELARYSKEQLEAMGTHEAFIELARRSASRGMRHGVKSPAERSAKKKAANNPETKWWVVTTKGPYGPIDQIEFGDSLEEVASGAVTSVHQGKLYRSPWTTWPFMGAREVSRAEAQKLFKAGMSIPLPWVQKKLMGDKWSAKSSAHKRATRGYNNPRHRRSR